jgi:hypothetical protein
MLIAPARLVHTLASWPARSQEAARRNALVAATALAARRRERDEVEEFLAHHAATFAGAPPATEHLERLA